MSGRVIVGIILVVLGVGFLAEVLTDVDFGSWLADWWPLILILIGGVQLFTQSAPRVASVILVVVGVVLLVWRVFDVDIDLWALIVALVLIAVGLSLVAPRVFGREGGVSSSDDLRYFVAFGGREERILAESFRGGSITNLFGGVEVDLRGSRLAPEGASLDVVSLFGGVEITVPPSWRVEISGTPLFGGWENKTRSATTAPAQAVAQTPSAPAYPGQAMPVGAPSIEGTVRVKAFVMFGGLEVHD